MKKIILTMAAIFTLGIASAQTDPKQVPQPPQAPSTSPSPPKTDIKTKPVKDAEIQNDAVNKQAKKTGEVQPRKDEMKTQEHVKGTTKPSTPDTVKPTRTEPKKKRQ